MRRFSFVALLSLLVCFLLTFSSTQSTASVPGVVPESGPEIERSVEDIVGTHAVPDARKTYDLYEAKGALAKKASAKCVATSLRNVADKCCTADGACCYCDGCEAGGGKCSCPEEKLK